MDKIDNLLKDLLIELTTEFDVKFKEDVEKVIKRALTDDAGNYFLKKGLLENFIAQMWDTLQEPSEPLINIEFLEYIEKHYKGVKRFPLFKVADGETLYFKPKDFSVFDFDELKYLGFYLIEWKKKFFVGIFDKNSERFALTEKDLKEQKYNNMLPLKNIKILGELERIDLKD